MSRRINTSESRYHERKPGVTLQPHAVMLHKVCKTCKAEFDTTSRVQKYCENCKSVQSKRRGRWVP